MGYSLYFSTSVICSIIAIDLCLCVNTDQLDCYFDTYTSDEAAISCYRCKFATTIPEDGIIIVLNVYVVKNKQYYNLQNGFIVDGDIVDTQFNKETTKLANTQIKTANTINIEDAVEMNSKRF